MSDELRRALKDLSPPPATPMISWGEAKSVDADAETCTVDVDGLIYEDVPLSIGQTGICIVPEENSLVLVCDIENTANIAILKCQEVKKIKLRADLIEMNGGENSGLVLVEKLTEKLNKIEKDLNALKQVFSSWTPVTQDGGAALKAASAQWVSQSLVESKKEDLENEKIVQ